MVDSLVNRGPIGTLVITNKVSTIHNPKYPIGNFLFLQSIYYFNSCTQNNQSFLNPYIIVST